MHKLKADRDEYLRKYRDTNREEMRAYDRERRQQRREWAIAELGSVCVQCGSTNHLHFDHIDPSTKIDEVSNLFKASEERLRAELQKCQLLCDRCHRIKTSAEHEYRPPAEHGSSQMYGQYHCRCDACRLWKRNYDIEWKRKRANQL